jgi:hypothetical protein
MIAAWSKVIMIAAWSIWIHRNNIIFSTAQHTNLDQSVEKEVKRIVPVLFS